jgi:acyl dehydratase
LPGHRFDLGSYRVTKEEIVEFGMRWIPQSFHVDEDAAACSPFGGLIASGWHTACIFMRLYHEHLLAHAAGMGSPGVRTMRWHTPVRPGDLLHASAIVMRATESTTRRDRGTVEMRWECHNDAGVPVLRMIGTTYFARRVPAGCVAPVTRDGRPRT